MRRALSALLLLAALGLSGCGGDPDDDATQARTAAPAPTVFSQEVRGNFLESCLENATNTASGAATQEQLTRTCACILGKVEQEYSQTEFAAFEQRLLGGDASEQESDRLVGWSTECARGAAG